MRSFLIYIHTFIKYFIILTLFVGFQSCKETSFTHQTIESTDNNLLIKTVYGNLVFILLVDEAPSTIKRFKWLVNTGYYDGITFHRVINNTLLQTGDPTNTGDGGTGVLLKDELSQQKHEKGTLAMALNDGAPDSADSQFFIALDRLPDLDNKFTIFGKMIKGHKLLNLIRKKDKILSISITNYTR